MGSKRFSWGVVAASRLGLPLLKDMHVAVVTSSLGSHGGNGCDSAKHPDDLGQALGSVRSGLKSWNGTGFLAWDPGVNRNQQGGVELDPANVDSDPQAVKDD